MKTNYMLRNAAGDWWLIDVSQSGEHYQKPKRVNHTAAEIIGMILEQKNVEEIAEAVSSRYGASRETVMQDVEELMEQLGME